MAVVTTYRCDRCGLEGEHGPDFRLVGLSEDLQPRRIPVISKDGEPLALYVPSALWCVACLIEFNLMASQGLRSRL